MTAPRKTPKPRPYEAQWYPSPINLPAATSGPIEVRHRIIPVGGEVIVVGHRQALLRGTRPTRGIVQDKPLRIHELVEQDQGLWMTDLPEELNQIAEMLHTVQPRGRVLVGGLGLGIVAALVADLPEVQTVSVVERSPDVIKLCARPGYSVHEAAIEHYLETSLTAYDYYLLDTWQGTNEGAWWEDVVPLRRLIRQRWGRRPRIHAWAEDIMLGQIVRNLMHCTTPHWYMTYLPVPMPVAEARRFVADVGLPAWEKKYGGAIDCYVQERDASRKEVAS